MPCHETRPVVRRSANVARRSASAVLSGDLGPWQPRLFFRPKKPNDTRSSWLRRRSHRARPFASALVRSRATPLTRRERRIATHRGGAPSPDRPPAPVPPQAPHVLPRRRGKRIFTLKKEDPTGKPRVGAPGALLARRQPEAPADLQEAIRAAPHAEAGGGDVGPTDRARVLGRTTPPSSASLEDAPEEAAPLPLLRDERQRIWCTLPPRRGARRRSRSPADARLHDGDDRGGDDSKVACCTAPKATSESPVRSPARAAGELG